MIDANNEGGNDNTNEPNRSSASACDPDDGTIPGAVMTGTRDSYNPWDLSLVIGGNQETERSINCLQNASD